MAYLVVKRNSNYKPHRSKICIVVLGNHKDLTFKNSKLFAPFLYYSSLWLLTSKAIEKSCILQQGDFKNAFCNALLPEDNITIVRLPLGDTDSIPYDFWVLNKTMYILRKSHQHWSNLPTNIIPYMFLTSSKQYPCLLSGIIDNGTPTTTPRQTIHVGLYLDDFVLFSELDAEDSRFKKLLDKQVATYFM